MVGRNGGREELVFVSVGVSLDETSPSERYTYLYLPRMKS